MKLSAWHNGNVPPEFPGVYKCNWESDGVYFNYFDGRYWYYGAYTPHEAMEFLDKIPKRHKLITWCGLAEKPKVFKL